MALSTSTVFEVRTTGSDLNAGGFVTGSGGTDYSQQDSAQYSFTDLVIDASLNTKVTSASHSFVSGDVGNLINVSAGTGFTVGRYQIVSVASGAATLDRAVGTGSSTGGTWKLGGALASWAIAAASATVAGITIWVKSGTYTIASNTINAATGPVQTQTRTLWQGYGSTRGDLGGPPVLFNGGTATNKILFDDSGQQAATVINLSIDNNNVTGCTGFKTGPFSLYYLCRAYRNPGYGIQVTQETNVYGCYVEGNQYGFDTQAYAHFYACVAKGQTSGQFNFGSGGSAHHCIAYGGSSDGFVNNARSDYVNCVAYGNGRYGFNQSAGQALLTNCVAEGNTQWGVIISSGVAWLINQASYNNTSGALSGTPLYNQTPITGSGSFFVAAGSGNFALNSTAGAGALLKGLGYPQAFVVNGTVSVPDIGAAQSGSGGGGGSSAGSWVFVG